MLSEGVLLLSKGMQLLSKGTRLLSKGVWLLSKLEIKKDLPKLAGPFANYMRVFNYSSTAACAAARRAIGTRNGEQDA